MTESNGAPALSSATNLSDVQLELDSEPKHSASAGSLLEIYEIDSTCQQIEARDFQRVRLALHA